MGVAMKKAAVIIEKWKLAIFTRHLRNAGYSYDTAPGLQDDLLTLTVDYTNADAVRAVLQAAQNECAKEKK